MNLSYISLVQYSCQPTCLCNSWGKLLILASSLVPKSSCPAKNLGNFFKTWTFVKVHNTAPSPHRIWNGMVLPLSGIWNESAFGNFLHNSTTPAFEKKILSGKIGKIVLWARLHSQWTPAETSLMVNYSKDFTWWNWASPWIKEGIVNLKKNVIEFQIVQFLYCLS